jgi:hypothetical protein
VDRNIGVGASLATHFRSIETESLLSFRSERKAALQLRRGEALILILLLSLGLWATIWGAVALLAGEGR